MNFFDMFLYSSILDARRAKQERKTEATRREQAAINNYDRVGETAEAFGNAVVDIAEKVLNQGLVTKSLMDGVANAMEYAIVSVARACGGMNTQQGKTITLLENNFPGGASAAHARVASSSSMPLQQLYPMTYLTETDCGTFWRTLYRICDKQTNPSAALHTVLDRYEDYMDSIAALGGNSASSRNARSRIIELANAHFADADDSEDTDFDVRGEGSATRHMSEVERLFWDVFDKSNARADIDNPEFMITQLKAITIADRVMDGDIPASDKITETEFYFAQFHVEMDITAREYLLGLSGQDEGTRQLKSIFSVVDGEVPGFWSTCLIMAHKVGLDDEVVQMTKEYYGFVMCLATDMRKKYPNGNYTEEKARAYGLELIESIRKATA